MAYGSGTSLTGLSFTPLVAIYTAQLGEYMDKNFFICTKGTGGPTCHTVEYYGDSYICYINCTFGTNSVTISKYGETNYPIRSGYIAAFGN